MVGKLLSFAVGALAILVIVEAALIPWLHGVPGKYSAWSVLFLIGVAGILGTIAVGGAIVTRAVGGAIVSGSGGGTIGFEV
jgi:hypothetical protein